MTNKYLELAGQGKNDWWRYLATFICLFLFLAFLVEPLLNGIASLVNRYAMPTTDNGGLIANFALINVVPLGVMLVMLVAIRFFHSRSIKTVVTPRSTIRWQRILHGFAAWLFLQFVLTVIDYFLNPAGYVVTFQATAFLIFLPIALILTPIQTTAEEFLHRGYIMQGLYRIIKKPVWCVVLTAVLFMLPHINNGPVQENFWVGILYFLNAGFLLAVITVKDEGLELALGVHAANNLYQGLVVARVNDQPLTPAIFTVERLNMGLTVETVLLVLCSIAFYFYFFGTPWRRQALKEE